MRMLLPALLWSCGHPLAGTLAEESFCRDGIDDDGDGRVDCEDGDCVEACSEDDCADGVDEDDNGLVDCDDEDCWASPVCEILPVRAHRVRLHSRFDVLWLHDPPRGPWTDEAHTVVLEEAALSWSVSETRRCRWTAPELSLAMVDGDQLSYTGPPRAAWEAQPGCEAEPPRMALPYGIGVPTRGAHGRWDVRAGGVYSDRGRPGPWIALELDHVWSSTRTRWEEDRTLDRTHRLMTGSIAR